MTKALAKALTAKAAKAVPRPPSPPHRSPLAHLSESPPGGGGALGDGGEGRGQERGAAGGFGAGAGGRRGATVCETEDELPVVPRPVAVEEARHLNKRWPLRRL